MAKQELLGILNLLKVVFVKHRKGKKGSALPSVKHSQFPLTLAWAYLLLIGSRSKFRTSCY